MHSSKNWLLAIAAMTFCAGAQAADDGYSTTTAPAWMSPVA
jgi:hypothetical protein